MNRSRGRREPSLGRGDVGSGASGNGEKSQDSSGGRILTRRPLGRKVLPPGVGTALGHENTSLLLC